MAEYLWRGRIQAYGGPAEPGFRRLSQKRRRFRPLGFSAAPWREPLCVVHMSAKGGPVGACNFKAWQPMKADRALIQIVLFGRDRGNEA